jgi:hypothetical protein
LWLQIYHPIIKYWSLAKIKFQSSVGVVREPPLPERNWKNASVQLNTVDTLVSPRWWR